MHYPPLADVLLHSFLGRLLTPTFSQWISECLQEYEHLWASDVRYKNKWRLAHQIFSFITPLVKKKTPQGIIFFFNLSSHVKNCVVWIWCVWPLCVLITINAFTAEDTNKMCFIILWAQMYLTHMRTWWASYTIWALTKSLVRSVDIFFWGEVRET